MCGSEDNPSWCGMTVCLDENCRSKHLAGMIFVLIGSFYISPEEKLKAFDAHVVYSVSRQTEFLIRGTKASSLYE